MWRKFRLRATGVTLFASIWVVFSASCVLEEFTTSKLCGKFATASAECGECSKEACCTEESACRNSATCSALYDCLAPCDSEPACITACAQAYPNDVAGQALARCHVTSCSATCTTCSFGLSGVSPSCDECTRSNCCDTFTACTDNENCNGIAQCIGMSDVPSVAGACRFDYSEGQPDAERTLDLYFDVANCSIDLCQAACELGTFWECTGNHDWDVTDQSTVNVGARFSGPTGGRVQGLTVNACDAFDTTCANPLGTGTTDMDGRATVAVSVESDGFTGFLEVTGAGHVPGLVFMNQPFVRDATWGWAALTEAEGEQVGILLGDPLDPSRGHLLVNVHDCRRTPGLGVQLDVGDAADAESTEFYFVNGLPSAVPTATKGDGTGGWINLQPGAVTLLGKLEETGEVVSTLVITIRAGTLTSVNIAPDSR